jgi:very-short-patch-repair endonuclease
MGEPFKNYGTKEEPLYIAAHVMKSVGFLHNGNRHRYIVKMKPDEAIRAYRIGKNKKTFNMLTLKGLKRFLCYTRKNVPEEILKYYGITEYNKINTDETLWLANIRKAFSGEQIIEQFALDKYRLDAYLPQQNIIIEVDENGHSAYNVAEEAERTRFINQVLKNPTWIRFDPYRANIFEVIGQIYLAITTKKK